MGGFGRRSVVPSLVLAAFLLVSGCADPAPAGAAASTSVSAGPDTGSIRAVALDAEQIPISTAAIELAGTDFRAITSEDGVALFEGLPPGAYTVVGAKAGFKPRMPKGQLVDVLVGETKEVKVELEPVLVVDAANTYHFTHPFTGFISCTIQPYTLGSQSCGRQTAIPDPNGKSQHEWKLDNAFTQSLVLEAKWTPSVGALPSELSFGAYRTKTCSAQAPSCTMNDLMVSVRGPSPLHGIFREDSVNNLTKRFGQAQTYPKTFYAEMLAYCPQPGCYASIVANQKYDAWITAFYGEQAPEGWSVIPK